ncbi:MAG: glycosyltransferase family 2 protein [Patescibacteria group bacterium]|nr:glycosyltransferase family 2 protein [Patescibacteria group bacterium]
MPRFAVIIPNFNGKKILKACLNSLERQTRRDFKIYVVDNGSTDGSGSMVEKYFPRAKLIRLKKNTGFARATNIGIRRAFSDYPGLKYICPLNNDVEVSPVYLQSLDRAAQKYQNKKIKLGVLAAKLLFKKQPHRLNSAGTVIQIDGSGMERGFLEKDRAVFNRPASVFGSCAAACLYTAPMLKKISFKNKSGQTCYFDPDFFAYYEDLDLNYRSRLAGFKAYFAPKALAWHLHSATGQAFSPFKSFHVHRNQFYVLIKNFPWPFLIMGLAFMPVRYLMLFLSSLLGRGPSAKLKQKVKGPGLLKIVFSSWKDIIKNLPGLIEKRRFIQKNRVVNLGEFAGWFRKYPASFRKMIF